MDDRTAQLLTNARLTSEIVSSSTDTAWRSGTRVVATVISAPEGFSTPVALVADGVIAPVEEELGLAVGTKAVAERVTQPEGRSLRFIAPFPAGIVDVPPPPDTVEHTRAALLSSITDELETLIDQIRRAGFDSLDVSAPPRSAAADTNPSSTLPARGVSAPTDGEPAPTPPATEILKLFESLRSIPRPEIEGAAKAPSQANEPVTQNSARGVSVQSAPQVPAASRALPQEFASISAAVDRVVLRVNDVGTVSSALPPLVASSILATIDQTAAVPLLDELAVRPEQVLKPLLDVLTAAVDSSVTDLADLAKELTTVRAELLPKPAPEVEPVDAKPLQLATLQIESLEIEVPEIDVPEIRMPEIGPAVTEPRPIDVKLSRPPSELPRTTDPAERPDHTPEVGRNDHLKSTTPAQSSPVEREIDLERIAKRMNGLLVTTGLAVGEDDRSPPRILPERIASLLVQMSDEVDMLLKGSSAEMISSESEARSQNVATGQVKPSGSGAPALTAPSGVSSPGISSSGVTSSGVTSSGVSPFGATSPNIASLAVAEGGRPQTGMAVSVGSTPGSSAADVPMSIASTDSAPLEIEVPTLSRSTTQLLNANTMTRPQVEQLMSVVTAGSSEEILVHMLANLEQALVETTVPREQELLSFVNRVRDVVLHDPNVTRRELQISSDQASAPGAERPDEPVETLESLRSFALERARSSAAPGGDASTEIERGAKLRSPQMVQRYWSLLGQQIELLAEIQQSEGSLNVEQFLPIIDLLDEIEQQISESDAAHRELAKVLTKTSEALLADLVEDGGAPARVRGAVAALIAFGAAEPQLTELLPGRLLRGFQVTREVARSLFESTEMAESRVTRLGGTERGIPGHSAERDASAGIRRPDTALPAVEQPGSSARADDGRRLARDRIIDLFRLLPTPETLGKPAEIDVAGALAAWGEEFAAAVTESDQMALVRALREQLAPDGPDDPAVRVHDALRRTVGASLGRFLDAVDRDLRELLEPVPSERPHVRASGRDAADGTSSKKEDPRSELRTREGELPANGSATFSRDGNTSGTPPAPQLNASPTPVIPHEAVQGYLRLVQGQEALGRMNPILRALGEPALVLFPVLLHGMLERIEVLSYPIPAPGRQNGTSAGDQPGAGESDGGPNFGDPGERAPEGYVRELDRGRERLTFHVPLPSLGDIDVEVLYGEHQVTVHLRCAGEAEGSFLGAALPDLERHLSDAGYRSISLETTANCPVEPLRPEWLANNRGPSRIA